MQLDWDVTVAILWACFVEIYEVDTHSPLATVLLYHHYVG